MKQLHRRFAFFILYCVLLLITLFRHEMWRDELQAWNIATGSSSLSDLFHNIRYEGHPSLWFIILWLLSKISHAPQMMQLPNFIFAAITSWLILFRSPFSLSRRVMIIFGYYFFYEYAAISRNYMIEVMMVIMICCMWKDVRKNFLWLLMLLFLMCQTNSYGYILSASFAFALFVHALKDRSFSFLKSASFLFASLLGIGIAFLTSAPPKDSEFNLPIHFAFDQQRFLQVFTNCWNAFFPLPRLQFPFWSEPMIRYSSGGCILGLLLLIAIVILSVHKSKLMLTFLLPAFLGMICFMYFQYPGFQRHFGHLFIAYVAFLWLTKVETTGVDSTSVQKNRNFGIWNFSFYDFLLIVQLITGIGFAISDWIFPFSNGKAAASFIKTNYPETTVVAGYTDCPAVTVAGYLNRNVYFLNNLRDASFVIYKVGRLNVEDSDVFRNLFTLADSSKFLVAALNFRMQLNGKSFLPESGKDTTVVVSLHGNGNSFVISNKATFTHGMVGGEDFTVYEIRERERAPMQEQNF